MIYAIEISGYGKRTRYAEDAARRAAAEMGLTVSAVGDLWQILHATH